MPKAGRDYPNKECTMTTTTRAPKAQSVPVTTTVEVSKKATAAEHLEAVLTLLDRQTAKPIDDPEQVKFGKAIGLLGGGSVYINRGNADVRSTPKQISLWAKAIAGSQVRGPQNQYLRISF